MSGKKHTTQKGFFKRLLAKYDAFCQEIGVDNGACRSCVPIVRQDPEPKKNSS